MPEAYTTWRDSAPDRRGDEPLSSIPLLTLYGMGFSGVALGLARRLPRCFQDARRHQEAEPDARCAGSVARASGDSIARRQGHRPTAIGARLSARHAARILGRGHGERALSLEQRAQLRIAITGAMEQACRVVDFAYSHRRRGRDLQGSPFERRFRDMHTVTAQGQAHLSNFEGAGQALFGIETAQRL